MGRVAREAGSKGARQLLGEGDKSKHNVEENCDDMRRSGEEGGNTDDEGREATKWAPSGVRSVKITFRSR